MSLLQKLQKQSKIQESSILTDSIYFTEVDSVSTPVPMINVALSGRVDGGLQSGLIQLCGNSKHFKTSFGLLMAAAYLNKHEDAVLIFYDSEFGSPQDYFQSFGIDTNRVLHCPITNIESLKFDLANQLKNIERSEKVIIMIDSIGNLASKKEVEDAENESSKADMTRAKQLKSVFRIATPHLRMKEIPMIVVNHIYMEQGMFPKAVVSGGTGMYLSSDNIWIIGRSQDKIGAEIQGYHFVINIEKSRYVKEKSKIPISVSWEGGIMKWSGLLDVALQSGHIKKPKNGWYAIWDRENDVALSKNYRAAETQNAEFWEPLLKDKSFTDWIEEKFSVSHVKMIQDELEPQLIIDEPNVNNLTTLTQEG